MKRLGKHANVGGSRQVAGYMRRETPPRKAAIAKALARKAAKLARKS